jgi:dihydroorotase
VFEAAGLHVLPGVIDTQVHFREPGQTQKEDLETGSRSAVMGGVTAVFEMPNTDPLTVTEAAFADKIKRGRHRMHCDFAFFIGGTRENVNHLPELERALWNGDQIGEHVEVLVNETKYGGGGIFNQQSTVAAGNESAS